VVIAKERATGEAVICDFLCHSSPIKSLKSRLWEVKRAYWVWYWSPRAKERER